MKDLLPYFLKEFFLRPANPMKTYSLLLGTLLLLSSCSTTKKATDNINDNFATAPAFDPGFSGLLVYDPQEKKVLYSHNGDKYFTPASNTKLFTFYTGLMTLGDSVPALKYTVKNDSLIFWGTGDPSFLHEQLPDSKVYEFLKNREEDLYYAAPSYVEDHFGPGWAWDDYNSYYSVERGAFPIHGNYVTVIFREGDSVPQTIPSFFQDSLQLNKNSLSKRSRAVRNISKNQFVFQHPLGNEGYTQEVPFKYSAELVASILSDTLQRPVTLLKEVMDYLKPEKTLYSISADSMYQRMLQVSDNFIAEQVLLLAAGEISDTLKSEIAIDYMMENHLQDLPDEPQWVDGSGLSRYNLFTPRSVVRLLEKISAEVPQERLFPLLPAGGESGTIRNWYKAEEPYIFAKTGTLENNHSLSGFLKTKSGKTLIFSFMNSNYTGSSSEVKKEMEKILELLRDNF